ncbi:metallophosphoesterase [Alkalihalobacillus sp. AL-G]|uniref:metallophosphoesterase family protein n=1 Tax=Alkalihalobacillus sp. AL-G TaxID=2926399 RepID=UPI002729F4ED|nr:metallophosphoesterase [Alkalihalobacillus sp. AL-G]WLD94389.1 metallophosphatase family protein [Alkalihalobacillus sp. AL-G]
MQSKIAIFTDVHGNFPALNAVLDDIDKRQEIDHIFCLGDMIAIGPDTNEVLEALFARNDISMITGNHDEAVLALINGEEHPKSHIHVREHHEWIAERMDKSYIAQLEKIPRLIKKNIFGNSLLFIHYHIEKHKLNEPLVTIHLAESYPQVLKIWKDYLQDTQRTLSVSVTIILLIIFRIIKRNILILVHLGAMIVQLLVMQL